jgi:hypothetical protein
MIHYFPGAGRAIRKPHRVYFNVYDSTLKYLLGRDGFFIEIHKLTSCIKIPLITYTSCRGDSKHEFMGRKIRLLVYGTLR